MAKLEATVAEISKLLVSSMTQEKKTTTHLNQLLHKQIRSQLSGLLHVKPHYHHSTPANYLISKIDFFSHYILKICFYTCLW